MDHAMKATEGFLSQVSYLKSIPDRFLGELPRIGLNRLGQLDQPFADVLPLPVKEIGNLVKLDKILVSPKDLMIVDELIFDVFSEVLDVPVVAVAVFMEVLNEVMSAVPSVSYLRPELEQLAISQRVFGVIGTIEKEKLAVFNQILSMLAPADKLDGLPIGTGKLSELLLGQALAPLPPNVKDIAEGLPLFSAVEKIESTLKGILSDKEGLLRRLDRPVKAYVRSMLKTISEFLDMQHYLDILQGDLSEIVGGVINVPVDMLSRILSLKMKAASDTIAFGEETITTVADFGMSLVEEATEIVESIVEFKLEALSSIIPIGQSADLATLLPTENLFEMMHVVQIFDWLPQFSALGCLEGECRLGSPVASAADLIELKMAVLKYVATMPVELIEYILEIPEEALDFIVAHKMMKLAGLEVFIAELKNALGMFKGYKHMYSNGLDDFIQDMPIFSLKFFSESSLDFIKEFSQQLLKNELVPQNGLTNLLNLKETVKEAVPFTV